MKLRRPIPNEPFPSNRRRVLGGAVFFIALAIFWASENPWQSAIVGRQLGSPFPRALFIWLVHWSVWGLLAFPIAKLARRFTPSWRQPGVLLVHVLGAVGTSVIHLAVMRMVVYAALFGFGDLAALRESLVHDIRVLAHKNLLTYVGIVAATLGLDAFRRAREHEVRTARLAEQLAQAELAALRMQLHPHFLFNSLHSAAELAHEDPAAAERAILGLADLLRRALRASRKAEVTLAEELEFVDGYLTLEHTRLEGKLTVEYHVPEELLDVFVPSLILQPLIENAIRHGIARRAGGGGIDLTVAASGDGRLVLVVENDAPPVKRNTPARLDTGIGLANVGSRLAQRFGAAASLQTFRLESGRFRVRIILPLERTPDTAAPSSDAIDPSSEVLAATATSGGVP